MKLLIFLLLIVSCLAQTEGERPECDAGQTADCNSGSKRICCKNGEGDAQLVCARGFQDAICCERGGECCQALQAGCTCFYPNDGEKCCNNAGDLEHVICSKGFDCCSYTPKTAKVVVGSSTGDGSSSQLSFPGLGTRSLSTSTLTSPTSTSSSFVPVGRPRFTCCDLRNERCDQYRGCVDKDEPDPEPAELPKYPGLYSDGVDESESGYEGDDYGDDDQQADSDGYSYDDYSQPDAGYDYGDYDYSSDNNNESDGAAGEDYSDYQQDATREVATL